MKVVSAIFNTQATPSVRNHFRQASVETVKTVCSGARSGSRDIPFIPLIPSIPAPSGDLKMKANRGLIATLLFTLLLGAARLPAFAQSDTVPKEVSALFTDLDDIDKMRVLGPLKLKADQLDKIIEAITAAQDVYVKKVTDAAVPPIKQIAAEIKETRKKVIAGSPIPEDFDAKVKKLQADFVKRRAALNEVALKSLSDSIRDVLTKSQIDKAISLAKSLTLKDGEPTFKGSDNQFFNLFVKGTFMDYGGIVPLLKDIRTAVSSASRANLKREARK
jgi:hypothetical protein